MPAQGVRVCFVDTPNTQIELIEPLGEDIADRTDSSRRTRRAGSIMSASKCPISTRPRRGSTAKGAKVLGEPRIGAHGTPIFFVHPKDMGGVLTEIMETPSAAH